MSSNTATVNEIESEDIVYDYPDSNGDDEASENPNLNSLKIVGAEDSHSSESDQTKIEPSEETQTDEDEDDLKNIDALIDQLPDNFPEAMETIKNEIAPILANCDPGLLDHYITVIRKKTNAS